MKKLTKNQMNDMVSAVTFAKDIEKDTTHYDMKSVKRGRKLLESWNHKTTARTTSPNYARHTKNAENAICVDAGWIATSPAFRFIIFTPKA